MLPFTTWRVRLNKALKKRTGLVLSELNGYPKAYPLETMYKSGILPAHAADAASDIAFRIGLGELFRGCK